MKPLLVIAICCGIFSLHADSLETQVLSDHIDRVEGNTATLTIGSDDGVVPGMTFDVYGQGELLEMVITGEKLIRFPRVVGRLLITDVGRDTSQGALQGEGPFHRGMQIMGLTHPSSGNQPPSLAEILPLKRQAAFGQALPLTLKSSDPEGEWIDLTLQSTAGRLERLDAANGEWQWLPPLDAGVIPLNVTLNDGHSLINAVLKNESLGAQSSLFQKNLQVAPRPLLPGGEFPRGWQQITALALDNHRRLLVVDQKQGLVFRLDNLFQVEHVIGEDAPGGHLEGACDIDVNHDAIYVLDQDTRQVVVFNHEGTFIRAFGRKGSDFGMLQKPRALALHQENNVLVLDEKTGLINVFEPNGYFRLAFGKTDQANYTLDEPIDLAVNRDGDILVLDQEQKAIVFFDHQYRYLKTVPCGRHTHIFSLEPGLVVCVNEEIGRLELLPLDDRHKDHGFQLRQPHLHPSLVRPGVLCSAPDRTLYISDQQQNLVRINPDGRLNGMIGAQARSEIIALDFDPTTQHLVLLEEDDFRITRWNTDGMLQGRWPTHHSQSLDEAVDMAVSSDSSVWLLDGDDCLVMHLDAQGHQAVTFGREGRGQGEMRSPERMVLWDQHLLIWDRGNEKLIRFTMEGLMQAEWSLKNLLQPLDLDITPLNQLVLLGEQGQILILDDGGNVIQEIQLDEEFKGAQSIRCGLDGSWLLRLNDSIVHYDPESKQGASLKSELPDRVGPFLMSPFGEILVTDNDSGALLRFHR